jgi:hypothetical protein
MAKEKTPPTLNDVVDARVKKLNEELEIVRKKCQEALKNAAKTSVTWREKLEQKAAEWKMQLMRAEEQAYKKALDFVNKKEAEKKKALLAAETKFEKQFMHKAAAAKKKVKKVAKKAIKKAEKKIEKW